MNNNGLISFDQPVRAYTPQAFPLSTNCNLIAPFWADVDTRDGRGRVLYRDASTEEEVMIRARNEIRRTFVNQTNFQPNFVFIATWERVGHFGGDGSTLVSECLIKCTLVQSCNVRSGF